MFRRAICSSMFLVVTMSGCAGVSVTRGDWIAQSSSAASFDKASEECTQAANNAISLDNNSMALIGAMIVGVLVGASSPQAGASSMNGFLNGARGSGANQSNSSNPEEIAERCMRSNGWGKR